MKTLITLFKLAFLSVLVAGLSIFGSDLWVKSSAHSKLYTSVKEIPSNKVGLLLGTSKILANGRINLYYQYRINAAAELYHANKIKFILASGDNGRTEYDEPTLMKEDLIAKGVPANKIYLDYAGFRTLDSVVRCKEIFGQEKITVISQPFHNERAIFIANRKGIDAIAYNAKDVSLVYGKKTQLRERLARVKMMLDLVFGKQPKFLGERIDIK